MRISKALMVGALGLFLAVTTLSPPAPTQYPLMPNVVFILPDRIGYDDLGAEG